MLMPDFSRLGLNQVQYMEVTCIYSNKQENGEMGLEVVVSSVPTPMLKSVKYIWNWNQSVSSLLEWSYLLHDDFFLP